MTKPTLPTNKVREFRDSQPIMTPNPMITIGILVRFWILDFRFWIILILDFRFWTCTVSILDFTCTVSRFWINPQSKIQNRDNPKSR